MWYDNLKEDFKKDASNVNEKLETTQGRSVVRYVAYAIILGAIIIISLMIIRGCTTEHKVYNTAYIPTPVVQEVPVQQPVYQQNNGYNSADTAVLATAGILTGVAIGAMISNGHGGYYPYDGHNGYYDSHYRGPSYTRVQNIYVTHKTVAPVKVVPTSVPNTASVGTKPTMTYPTPNVAKVRNPGDIEAERQQKIMRQVEERKASLKAAQEARKQSNSSGFNKMSKSSSSNSRRK